MGLHLSFTQVQEVEVASHNITHNLVRMAEQCKLYYPLWRPEELGITKAEQLITYLDEGLRLLKKDPEWFKNFEAPNGWGTYENFVRFVGDVLQACRDYPDAKISACR